MASIDSDFLIPDHTRHDDDNNNVQLSCFIQKQFAIRVKNGVQKNDWMLRQFVPTYDLVVPQNYNFANCVISLELELWFKIVIGFVFHLEENWIQHFHDDEEKEFIYQERDLENLFFYCFPKFLTNF